VCRFENIFSPVRADVIFISSLPDSLQPKKMSFGNFGSLRKKKQEESEEYVCPMDVEMPKGRSFQKGFELQIYEDDLDRLEQVSLF